MRWTFALFFTLTVAFSGTLAAQETPQAFLGYAIGDRFTPHHRIIDYFNHLADESPRVKHLPMGETYEGRPLSYAIITSERNQQRIDVIRQQNARLNDPRTTAQAEADEIVRNAPVIVWLAYGVHGDESSSAEAAMLVAHWLTTAEAAALLEETVVIIDPLQNPDGRERYIGSFHQRRGKAANLDPSSIEHSDIWPSGRTNHYYIDMNRDWAWGTQQETVARINAISEWSPQVLVDLHEMSAESTYFFPPDASPINSNIPAGTAGWLEKFGRANAEVFSARRWPFFVGERFDLFYPAYGDSWPTLRGAIGMTYEVAGGRRGGTAYKRVDDIVLTLADRAFRHFTSSITTIRTTAANRQALLAHQHQAIRDALKLKRSYLFSADSGNGDALLGLLRRQGVEIGALRGQTRARVTEVRTGKTTTETFPAGTVAVTTSQPLGHLINALLERSPKIDESFVAHQKERVTADEEDEFYDITAWSLPLAMNVPTYVIDAEFPTVPLAPTRPTTTFGKAAYAYVIHPQHTDIYRVVGRLLTAGVKFSVSSAPLEGKRIPRGAIVVERHRNGENLDDLVRVATAGAHVTVTAVDRVWSEGAALGSEDVNFVRPPAIAVVADEGVDANSLGAIWHTLDIQLEIPHSLVRLSTLGSRSLSKYKVVVLPDSNIDLIERIGKSGVENLKRWVDAGGTIVAIKGSSSALRAKEVELTKVEEWEPEKKDGDKDKDKEKEEVASEDERKNDFRIPGAAFRTTMNERSYLTFGLDSSPVVLIEGTKPFVALDRKANNIVQVVADDPLVAGFAWPESIERVRKAPYLTRERVGVGSIITFADEPHYRLFWRSTLPLFANAVLYSPTFNEEE